jgi:ribosomal protein L10
MVGPLIYGFSEDAVAAAKVIADFAKGNDKLVIKGGAYAGKALDADGVKALAPSPSREVLIAQVAGLLKSPIQRMAGVLAAWPSSVAVAAQKRRPKPCRRLSASPFQSIHRSRNSNGIRQRRIPVRDGQHDRDGTQ